MKIVINACYGGFSVSHAAMEHMGKEPDPGLFRDSCGRDIPRDDPLLIAAVEALGSAANGACAELKIVEIPDGVEWCIEEYDGIEWVAEVHRTWR